MFNKQGLLQAIIRMLIRQYLVKNSIWTAWKARSYYVPYHMIDRKNFYMAIMMNGVVLTLRLLMSYIYIYIYIYIYMCVCVCVCVCVCGAPSKARNANVVYIWTYVWQR